jgi:hypothetical protein
MAQSKTALRITGVALAVGVAVIGLVPTAHSAVTFSEAPQRVYGPASSEMYAYAPSAVTDGGHNYYYTCHNDIPGQIKDHVYFSQVDLAGASPQQDTSALQGTPGSWDSNHLCDPSIVAARVQYAGTEYSLAMFYLGTDYANSRNQIGVAFSNSFAGPWVKYPEPIVTTPFSDPNAWGVGMPSATTVDFASGRVLLFYGDDGNNSASGTRAQYDRFLDHGYFRDVTLGDMANPRIGAPVLLPMAGLTGTDGGTDILHNFDVAYNPSRDRFYVVRERHPFPFSEPWYITTELQVASIPAADLWNGTGSWTVESNITPADTGFARNHNPGFLRTRYGTLPDDNSTTVVFTRSDTGSFPSTLWGYELWQLTGTIR